MIEAVIILILCVTIFGQQVFLFYTINKLTDKIMARDLSELTRIEVPRNAPPQVKFAPDEHVALLNEMNARI